MLCNKVPEEINRKIVDHISDINLTYGNLKAKFDREGMQSEKLLMLKSDEEIMHNRKK